MYDDLARLPTNKNTGKKHNISANLDLVLNLKPYESYSELENKLKSSNKLNFKVIFNEPLGNYMIKSFLASIFSLPKAFFLADVDLYKKLRAESAKKKVAQLIFNRFVLPSEENNDESVFSRHKKFYNKYTLAVDHEFLNEFPTAFHSDKHNSIGYYDQAEISLIGQLIHSESVPPDLFRKIYLQIFNDLRFDIFPRFLGSSYYRDYIRLKSLEQEEVSIRDFDILFTVGYGAYGVVTAARKKNSGHLYAMKTLCKKHVIAMEQTKSVLTEKKLLSMMDSHFVTCLNYSFCDRDNIYLVLDLMRMGDLKKLLIHYGSISEKVARFYAAEMLLGLIHIHEKGIIYRDIKLENMLLDEKGHVKISDLGLSVLRAKTKGYAGTPGYTAPEVIKGDTYDKTADYFSLGVIIYRLISGKRPFELKMSDLDKNVLNIEPKYSRKTFSEEAASLIKGLLVKTPSERLGSGPEGIYEITRHRWFDGVDFGLLEAGYIDPPWVPGAKDMGIKEVRAHGNFNKNKYRKAKVSSSFQQRFEGFSSVSKAAVQKEVVEVLQTLDRIEMSELEHRHRGGQGGGCCSVM